MKSLCSNFFKKSNTILLAFAFIFTSLTVFPVKTYASETSAVEVSNPATTRSRLILTSDSVVGKKGMYMSGNFTTQVPSSLHHGMSYYIDCSSASVTFDIKVYKGNGTLVAIQNLPANNPLATSVFYLEGNTTYYFVVTPSNSNVEYDFAYNIYYDK